MAAAILLFLFFSAAISASAQQGSSNISLASSLTPTTTNYAWFSSSGIFAFGFYQTADGFAIGIFFASISERTVVWTANTSDPIVPDNIVLQLTSDGLVLQESDSQDIYSRIDNSSQPIAWASMLDNGNFVLYNSSGSVIWQSFDHPTDSLLPGQSLPPNGELLSRASETDFQAGIFRLKMQADANLVLYYVESLNQPIDAYYSSGTSGRGYNVSLNLDNDGHLYLFDGSYTLQNLTAGGYPVVGTIYLVRLDWDGIIHLYNRSSHQNADCKCLPGFGSVRPGQWSAGCTSNFMVDCTDKDQSSEYDMTSILNVTWEDNYYSASRGISEESCKEGCLKDCNCMVAFFKDGECRKQKLPLSYGRWLADVSDMAFVRVATTGPGNPSTKLDNLPRF